MRSSQLPPSTCVRSSHAARRAQWSRRAAPYTPPSTGGTSHSAGTAQDGPPRLPPPACMRSLRAACRALQTPGATTPLFGPLDSCQCSTWQSPWDSMHAWPGLPPTHNRSEKAILNGQTPTPASTPGHHPALPFTTSSSASFAFFFFNESNNGRLGDATANAIWLTKSSPCSCWRSRRQHRPHLRLPIGRLQ